MAAIGIDLGTTYSCVAIWRQGCVEVIANELGNRSTPSCVAFTQTERLIGEEARNQIITNPSNTVFGAKRLTGRRYDDIDVQLDLRHWPFKVSNKNSKPVILVKFKGETKSFAPEEICSMVIFRLKEIAERHLGAKVSKAVITVPAYFNDSQREATRLAGTIAGLQVLRVTNEPTAAALAYSLDRKGATNALIYDLGGSTLDVSVLSINGPKYEVKSTVSNIRLGGQDFDNRLVAYFAEDFRKKYFTDISRNAKALRLLNTAAERAKRFLTPYTEASVQVEALCDGIDFTGRISRAMFEELCSDLFGDTLETVKKVISEAKMKKSDINNIILVGGSSRIPKIQSLLKDFFDGKALTTSMNPDEAVVCGAAIQAAILNSSHKKDLLLIDVVPLALGIETAGGIMFKVIEKNTPVPCKRTKEIATIEDYQTSMTVEIFEGERSLTKHNNYLGTMELNGIPPAPRGIVKIDLTFEVDENGILSVSADDRCTGNGEKITIKNEHRLNYLEIGKMISDAAEFQQQDKENRRRLEVRNQLESYIYDVKHNTTEMAGKLTERERDFMQKECHNALQWLEENQECIREEYERQMTDLMRRWSEILLKIHENPLRFKIKRQRRDCPIEYEKATF